MRLDNEREQQHRMSDGTVIPDVLTDELHRRLARVSTATLTSQLQKRGIRSTFLSGLKPTHPDLRLIGRARTLRYVALREDLQAGYSSGLNAQRRAVEGIEPGDVLVIEARGVPDAGTIGDIYTMRVHARGGVGVITDGALRDTAAIASIPIAVYHRSSHGATFSRHHMPFAVDDGITCAEVFVLPGDVVVGDAEGVVVIPAGLVGEVTGDALAQEEAEEFALERVAAGEPTLDVFPLGPGRRAEFDAWAAARAGGSM